AALISAIYVFSQLASQSEYTIFRVAGLNTRQALFSLFKLAIPLAIATFLFGAFIGPKTEQYAQKVKLDSLGATVSSGFRSGVWVKDRGKDPATGGELTRFVNVAGLKP
ncbi:LptF/LptG family permease, partial [Burkholderia cenocepacia]|uniref:LptF/LptG family permease n=1 Tax=Burkholderia cenocepacia TaxID=95486 RepID=UPI0022318496